MVYRTVFNTTDSAVVVDPEGRQVAGRSWGTAETVEQEFKDGVKRGDLIVIEEPDSLDDVNPEAAAAFKHTAEVTDRKAQLKEMEKSDLVDYAREQGLVGEDEKLSKAAVVEELAEHTEVDLPQAPADEDPEPAPVSKSRSTRKV